MALDITNENFEREVLQESKPVIVDVHASWCGPCQMMAPIFDELEKDLGTEIKFVKLNVDEARELSIQLGITSVPTFLFYKNGNIQEKAVGFMSKNDLQEKIRGILE